MKKLLLSIVLISCVFAVNAQDKKFNIQDGKFNVGGSIGLPIGDASDFYDVTGSIEANYLFAVSNEFKVGPSVSYLHFNGVGADFGFLPLAAAARYNISEEFVVGADLGYGIGVRPSYNDGGFYYRPMVGYNITQGIMAQATYSGVSLDGGSASTISLGVMFAL